MTTITVEEFRRQQREDLERRRNLRKTDPAKARREAIERLRRANIIDSQGNFVPTARG
ncbi:MAG: hypothetical protein J6D54_12230 [Olsenella sp.]|nr:hypothetical protein [Olsenella sp.]